MVTNSCKFYPLPPPPASPARPNATLLVHSLTSSTPSMTSASASMYTTRLYCVKPQTRNFVYPTMTNDRGRRKGWGGRKRIEGG